MIVCNSFSTNLTLINGSKNCTELDTIFQKDNSIQYLPQLNGWLINTEISSYIIARSDKGRLQHVYWGGRLYDIEQSSSAYFPEALLNDDFDACFRDVRCEEYPAWGGPFYDEPCLKITLENGVRDCVLQYVSNKIQNNRLEIELKDIRHNIFVTLIYEVYPEIGIISKKSKINNQTGQKLIIGSAQSGVWQLPADKGYRLTYIKGSFGNEAHIEQELLKQGKRILEGRRGSTGYESNPWFAIDYKGEATEDAGKVWFGSLGWSGNWQITIEQTSRFQPRITGGFNTFDFGYLLNSGESLETPPFYGGFTPYGFGEASRILHQFQREKILPQGKSARLRPVFYNSWQVYKTNVTEENQKELAEKVSRLGIELFLVDDGWFHLRKKTDAGLGDWFVDRDKFPNGLLPLSKFVNSLGMDFGLWIEPEMINPKSNLFKYHPDWIVNFPGCTPTKGREQYVLNLARDDVREFLFNTIDKLVEDNNVKMFKWDNGRLITEPGWPEVPVEEQKRFWVKYTENLYNIMDRLRKKHPELEIESCKGGGARIDLGIMKYVDQFWISDNTDPIDRLDIQEGFSYAYSPGVLMGRVSAQFSKEKKLNVRENTPLEFSFIVAMMGSLGISLDPDILTDDQVSKARNLVDFYKSIRETVQRGDLYRLSSPRKSNITVNQFISEDGGQSVVFAIMPRQDFFSQHSGFNQPFYLRGLDTNALYQIKPMHKEKLVENVEKVSGSYLEKHGIKFRFANADKDATVVVIERLPLK